MTPIRCIRNMYRQRGHLFYRDGMTYNNHSAGSFYRSMYNEDTPKHDIVLASTFQNFGKMMDKRSTSFYTAHLLCMYGMPSQVWKPISILDMARDYLFTIDPVYRQKTPRSVKPFLKILSSGEIEFFIKHQYYTQAVSIAVNDLDGNNNAQLGENQWFTLEDCLKKVCTQ